MQKRLFFKKSPASYIDETAGKRHRGKESKCCSCKRSTFRRHAIGMVEPGCVIVRPRQRQITYKGLENFFPATYKERCIKCGLCWIFCPDMAYNKSPEGFYLVALDYCKGCGICARECPTGAISMVEEKEPIL